MDNRTPVAEPQFSFPPSPWSTTTTATASSSTTPPQASTAKHTAATTPRTSTPKLSTATTPDLASAFQIADGTQDAASAAAAVAAGSAAAPQYPPTLDFLPYYFPAQSSVYHAQLLHYNKLISPSRGGGLQSPALQPVLSAPHVQAGSRSRSSSKVSLKDSSNGKGSAAGGHGSRSHHGSDKNRPGMNPKEAPAKVPAKPAADTPSKTIPSQRAAAASSSQVHSSSVPSTPHQHARQFSFESREPSPTAAADHSPRSAYSETNTNLPSLRPLPPRLGGCKYETAQMNSRRRMPYSGGNERLPNKDLKTVKKELSEDEERKLATDMRELYDRLLPTPAVEEKRKKMTQKLETIFNDEWPGHDIKVQMFGSSGNLLCSDDSDVDICITTPWRELEGVCMIADLLARRGMEKVVCIAAAKVPIVKIWDPELGLACDMNVNNTMALENTRMVRTYVEIDPRVRQLAMIIKYWTRRRIVNDAAFGGTLSSYTWICMIIAFLQVRNPAVLPALHTLPYKMPKSDGTPSTFADNLKRLKGLNKQNKSSEADLLFQFFRFYAYEFDYDKHVLSVRSGKLVTKEEKKWNFNLNNQLCVEEPFNPSRNLGNTADDYSFHGLHQELRRAFDLFSASKFEEACEQYVFPKEEERIFSRPTPQPRPVMLRSSSQSHSGRGGRSNHRGGRHNFHRGGGGGGGGGSSNRRASSSVPAYDTSSMFLPHLSMQPQQPMSWYQTPQYQFQYAQQDLMTQMAYQENMRQLHLYAQSPAFMQPQPMSQQRASSSTASGQQSADRSRTNSFDNPPLSAPMRPDLYALYGMSLSHAFYPHSATYGTIPSSPATVSGTGQDFRRPLQRSSGATDGGAPASNSSLRSQSQPASRPQSAAQSQPSSFHLASQTAATAPVFAPRNVNGIPIPSFMPDDADFDENFKAPISESPLSDEGKPAAFPAARRPSPTRQVPQVQGLSNGIAFGDLAGRASTSATASGPGRRRLSTDQLPQTILDRRMRRQSRSPSPLGHTHSRTISLGTSSAPLTSAPFPGSQNKNPSRPLVVNGSGLKASMNASPRNPPAPYVTEDVTAPPPYLENPLHINSDVGLGRYPAEVTPSPQQQSNPAAVSERPPVVVNGSSAVNPGLAESSFRERVANLNLSYMNAPEFAQDLSSAGASRQRLLASRQPQSGVIAPLDLAIAEHRMENPVGPNLAHLSPVYETRTPSPTALRKFDISTRGDRRSSLSDPKASRQEASKAVSKGDDRLQEGGKPHKVNKQQPQQSPKGNGPRENGHVRGKSDLDGVWQKAGKGKKKTTGGAGQQGLAEQPPRHDSERKGG